MKDEDEIRKDKHCAPDEGASAEAIEANGRMNELVEEDHALQVCCKDGWSGTQLEFEFPEDPDGVC